MLASVLELGHHTRLESPDGRRMRLYEGDEIIVAYGARYAPDQFDAAIPLRVEPCDLVAGGGIAGEVIARHAATKRPTRIAPIGIVLDARGAPLNVANGALRPLRAPPPPRKVIAVCGTSMNAGKTTTVSSLVRGLRLSGVRVGAAKLTGTGSGGDLWSMRDAGAAIALDFTDAGHATTCGLGLAALEDAADLLVDHLEAADVDIVVAEIADGLLQAETAALLRSQRFCARLDGIVFAAGDAFGALGGAAWLGERGLPLIAVSGLVSASPLAMAEAAKGVPAPILTIQQLSDPEIAPKLCFGAGDADARRAAL